MKTMMTETSNALYVCASCLKEIESREGPQGEKPYFGPSVCNWCEENKAEYEIPCGTSQTGDEEWFCVVRWCDEDIKSAFAEYGISDPSEDQIAEIRKDIRSSLEAAMVDVGWSIIKDRVFTALLSGE